VLAHGFDAVGNRTSLAATVGGAADFANSYVYDNLNRLARIDQAGQTGGAVAEKRVDLAYDAAGQWTAITRYADAAGTGLVATGSYTFDADGRITGLGYAQDAAALAAYGWGHIWGQSAISSTARVFS
jgi:hypothetical protein